MLRTIAVLLIALIFCSSSQQKSKAGSKKALLQPGTLVDMVVYHKNGKDLQRISEIRPWHIYSAIPFDIVKGSITLFIIELLYRSVREEEQNEGLFDLTANTLILLDQTSEPIGNLHLWFMIQLTRYLGFLPNGKWTGEACRFNQNAGESRDFLILNIGKKINNRVD